MHVQVQHGTCKPDTKSYALDDFPKIKKWTMKQDKMENCKFLDIIEYFFSYQK